MRKLWLAGLAALTSMALLVPAGSADAALNRVPFCGSYNPGQGYQPVTLQPGQICGFWPVAVRSAIVTWEIVRRGDPNSGAVCFGVLQHPPGWPNGKPLNPNGSGTAGNNWYCNRWNIADSVGGYGFTPYWKANNPFDAVGGQPVVVNFSTATIRTRPNYSNGYYDTLWYYG